MSHDINHDEVRRELRAIDAHHQATLRPTAELIDQLYQNEESTQTKFDLLVGGANRAKYLKVGGVAVLTSAVLAACGSSSDEGATNTTAGGSGAGAGSTTTGAAKPDAGDLKVLQFAASVELLAVAAYTKGAPLLKDKTAIAAATAFMKQHQEHAGLFNGAIKSAGGTEVTAPNAAYLKDLEPTIAGLKTEADVLKFAQDLEISAASTYFSTVGGLKNPKLSYAAMTVGGTEYRHAAVLAYVTKTPIAATKNGFLNVDKALMVKGV